MIHLTGTDWCIDADRNQFIVGKDNPRALEKKQYRLTDCTYHATLAAAIENIFLRLIREYVRTNDVSTTQAVEALKGKSETVHFEPIFRVADETRELNEALAEAKARLLKEGDPA